MRLMTAADAHAVFEAMAALGEKIAFRCLAEGCECRAQLMIEHMETMGLDPGRAWALMVGRPLVVDNPGNPKMPFKWLNHTAPTVAAEGVPHGVLVIDPSLSRTGPMTLPDWAGTMRVRSFAISELPLSQPEILEMQRVRTLAGLDLDAILFSLELGRAPIPEQGGSGFRIAPDPPQGVSVFAHAEMLRLLAKERMLFPDEP